LLKYTDLFCMFILEGLVLEQTVHINVRVQFRMSAKFLNLQNIKDY
jgi:hypothetical protein